MREYAPTLPELLPGCCWTGELRAQAEFEGLALEDPAAEHPGPEGCPEVENSAAAPAERAVPGPEFVERGGPMPP